MQPKIHARILGDRVIYFNNMDIFLLIHNENFKAGPESSLCVRGLGPGLMASVKEFGWDEEDTPQPLAPLLILGTR